MPASPRLGRARPAGRVPGRAGLADTLEAAGADVEVLGAGIVEVLGAAEAISLATGAGTLFVAFGIVAAMAGVVARAL